MDQANSLDMLWSAVIAIQRADVLRRTTPLEYREHTVDAMDEDKPIKIVKLSVDTYYTPMASLNCQVTCLLESAKSQSVGILVQVYQAGMKRAETRNLCSEGLQNEDGFFEYVMDLSALNGFFERVLKEVAVLDGSNPEARERLLGDIYMRVVSFSISV